MRGREEGVAHRQQTRVPDGQEHTLVRGCPLGHTARMRPRVSVPGLLAACAEDLLALCGTSILILVTSRGPYPDLWKHIAAMVA
jgi:hypothetical protein